MWYNVDDTIDNYLISHTIYLTNTMVGYNGKGTISP